MVMRIFLGVRWIGDIKCRRPKLPFLPCDAMRCTVFVIVILSVCLLVRERSALATIIFTLRVCLSFCHSVILSVRNFGAKYLGNEAR